MCELCSTSERLLELHQAVAMVDGLLEGIVEPVSKAVDLSTARGFDRAVALLSARLRRVTGPADAGAVRAAVSRLDIDWASATREQRASTIREAVMAAGKATMGVPTKIRATFGRAADELVRATRQDARGKQRLGIGADFNALDKRIVQHVVSTQGNFVRDEYGRRLDTFGARARAIVASGLEQGMGRDDLADKLEEAAKSAFIDKAPSYWDVVASAFTANTRSYSQMSSYAEAGITMYRISAVMDEHTTPICQFLDGKVFSVGDALKRFDKIERASKPEDIKTIAPWARERIDPETGRRQLYVNSESGQRVIAEIIRSAEGTRDDPGEFKPFVSNTELLDLGVSFPPYHGLCRTTTLAVV